MSKNGCWPTNKPSTKGEVPGITPRQSTNVTARCHLVGLVTSLSGWPWSAPICPARRYTSLILCCTLSALCGAHHQGSSAAAEPAHFAGVAHNLRAVLRVRLVRPLPEFGIMGCRGSLG